MTFIDLWAGAQRAPFRYVPRADAIAGRSVKVKGDVNLIGFAKPDRTVMFFDHPCVNSEWISIDDPELVIHGMADKFRPQSAHPTKIIFLEGFRQQINLTRTDTEKFQQIKPSPAWKRGL
jgi:hypothetical protein